MPVFPARALDPVQTEPEVGGPHRQRRERSDDDRPQVSAAVVPPQDEHTRRVRDHHLLDPERRPRTASDANQMRSFASAYVAPKQHV